MGEHKQQATATTAATATVAATPLQRLLTQCVKKQLKTPLKKIRKNVSVHQGISALGPNQLSFPRLPSFK